MCTLFRFSALPLPLNPIIIRTTSHSVNRPSNVSALARCSSQAIGEAVARRCCWSQAIDLSLVRTLSNVTIGSLSLVHMHAIARERENRRDWGKKKKSRSAIRTYTCADSVHSVIPPSSLLNPSIFAPQIQTSRAAGDCRRRLRRSSVCVVSCRICRVCLSVEIRQENCASRARRERVVATISCPVPTIERLAGCPALSWGIFQFYLILSWPPN